jgi:protein-tyrosine phosphatase
MAEGFLRSGLQARLDDRAPRVSSAGTQGWEGAPAQPFSVQAAAEREIDIAEHVARRLSLADIRAADLIVAMAGEHRDEVVEMAPDAADRTFTLKELVRLLEALPAPSGGLPARVREAAALRAGGFTGNARDEDIADPLGASVDTYRAIAWELDDWIRRLVDGLLGRAVAPATIFGEGGSA